LAALQIRLAGDSDRDSWDGYVRKHPEGSLFHLFGWRDIVNRTYGHPAYYLMAVEGNQTAGPPSGHGILAARTTVGVLPLIHIKHRIFGSSLVSLPFLDGGGFLADRDDVEKSLLREGINLARNIGATRMELRCERLLAGRNDVISPWGTEPTSPISIAERSDKVRMLLRLPDSAETLMKSFKAKLRSQVLKPLKEGMTSKTGGVELLADFYEVFSVNMRDLGSPVHSIELMRHVLKEFPERARIIVVYRSEEAVASALVVGFDKALCNPWASSVRKYAALSPNMLLYLRMLEFACDNGYRVFNFGRSTRGEGTYRFKEQWGAEPVPLYWYYISLDGKPPNPESAQKKRFEIAAHFWRKLPVVVTKLVGPRIRKHISL